MQQNHWTSWLKGLHLGPLHLPSALVQAPLAGVSCAPFRVLAHRYGKPGFCMTEMLSAHRLAQKGPQKKRYLDKDPREGFTIAQISGRNESVLSEAAAVCEQLGMDGIDLNAGCPVKKIRTRRLGSALVEEPDHLHRLIAAIRRGSDLPVSVKIRVLPDGRHVAAAQAAEAAGAVAITVHGRTWQERYDTPGCLEAIQAVVKAVDVPVIGNGDIQNADDVRAMVAQTGCAGVMVARASVGQPWLYQKISQNLQEKPFKAPVLSSVGLMLLEHITALASMEGELSALFQARRFCKYYVRQLKANPGVFLEQIKHVTEWSVFESLVVDFFEIPKEQLL